MTTAMAANHKLIICVVPFWPCALSRWKSPKWRNFHSRHDQQHTDAQTSLAFFFSVTEIVKQANMIH